MTKAQLPEGVATLNDFLHRQVSYPDAVFGPKLTIYLTVVEVNQEEEYVWLKYNHLASQARVGIPKFLEWLSTGEYTLLPEPISPTEEEDGKDPYCTECGCEDLQFLETYASGDYYRCPNCKKESHY